MTTGTDEVLRTAALALEAHREIFSHLLMVPGGNFFMAWASLTCSSSVKIAFRLSSSNRAASASARCRARSAASSFRCRAWRPPTAHFQRMRIRHCQDCRVVSDLARGVALEGVPSLLEQRTRRRLAPGPLRRLHLPMPQPCKSLSDFRAVSVDN